MTRPSVEITVTSRDGMAYHFEWEDSHALANDHQLAEILKGASSRIINTLSPLATSANKVNPDAESRTVESGPIKVKATDEYLRGDGRNVIANPGPYS